MGSIQFVSGYVTLWIIAFALRMVRFSSWHSYDVAQRSYSESPKPVKGLRYKRFLTDSICNLHHVQKQGSCIPVKPAVKESTSSKRQLIIASAFSKCAEEFRKYCSLRPHSEDYTRPADTTEEVCTCNTDVEMPESYGGLNTSACLECNDLRSALPVPPPNRRRYKTRLDLYRSPRRIVGVVGPQPRPAPGVWYKANVEEAAYMHANYTQNMLKKKMHSQKYYVNRKDDTGNTL